MELSKQDIETLLSLVHCFTDDDSTRELTSEETSIVERLETELVTRNILERNKTSIETGTNELGWRYAWFYVTYPGYEPTMELGGSSSKPGTFSMSVWSETERKWVNSYTLGDFDD